MDFGKGVFKYCAIKKGGRGVTNLLAKSCRGGWGVSMIFSCTFQSNWGIIPCKKCSNHVAYALLKHVMIYMFFIVNNPSIHFGW